MTAIRRDTDGADRDDQALPDPARVDPGVLGALLARHGWVRRGGRAGRYGRWTPPGEAGPGGLSLLVPAGNGYDDAADLVAEAVAALARSRLPSARSVLLALSVPGDEVRWEREVPGEAGAVPWESEDTLRGAAAEMLRAAAKAGRTRAAYFGARLDGEAAAFLRRVLVVESGGAGGLTAYAPAPEGRGVTTTLVRALEAMRDAVDYRRATGRPDAFDNAVRAGVSRELVASVERLVRGSEGAQIALAWSPAAGAPRGFADRSPAMEFSPGDLPALREAAERLEHSEPAVEVRITAAVVRLKRPRPDGAGSVRLRVLAGAEVAEVRTRLGEEAYRTAVEAHLAGVPLRLSGRLERKGGFRRLTRARDLALCDLDDAERDRLFKALRDRPEEDDR